MQLALFVYRSEALRLETQGDLRAIWLLGVEVGQAGGHLSAFRWCFFDKQDVQMVSYTTCLKASDKWVSAQVHCGT